MVFQDHTLVSALNEAQIPDVLLSAETKNVISVGRSWILTAFESQIGFWPGSSPGQLGSSPSMSYTVSA